MTWIETIRVSLGSRRAGDPAVADLLQSELADLEQPLWSFYSNPTVPEDLLIVFDWDFEDVPPGPSDLAQVLLRELKRYGLVSHAVWQQMAPASCRQANAEPKSFQPNRDRAGRNKGDNNDLI